MFRGLSRDAVVPNNILTRTLQYLTTGKGIRIVGRIDDGPLDQQAPRRLLY